MGGATTQLIYKSEFSFLESIMSLLQLQLLLQMSLLNMAYQPVNQLNTYDHELNSERRVDMLNQNNVLDYCMLYEKPCTKFIVYHENQASRLQFSKKI